MTLLLAANTHHGIVMLSDGLCRRLGGCGAPAVLATDQQKIFTFQKKPIAIAHHGQNQLKGQPVSEIITSFEATLGNVTSIREIAECLEQSLDSLVRGTLRELRAEGVKNGCGFWVGGYGHNDQCPSLYEVFWEPGGDQVEIAEKGVLTEGGEGKRFAKAVRQKHPIFSFTKKDAGTWSLLRGSDYVERLYKSASKEQGAREVFGGKVRKLWIERTGCKWIIK